MKLQSGCGLVTDKHKLLLMIWSPSLAADLSRINITCYLWKEGTGLAWMKCEKEAPVCRFVMDKYQALQTRNMCQCKFYCHTTAYIHTFDGNSFVKQTNASFSFAGKHSRW